MILKRETKRRVAASEHKLYDNEHLRNSAEGEVDCRNCDKVATKQIHLSAEADTHTPLLFQLTTT